MKTRLAFVILIALACGLFLAHADSILGNYKTITLDGDLSDWDSGDVMYPDAQIGDGLPTRTSYQDIYVANDADYLYVALHFKDTGGGPVSNDWLNRLYIDVDMDGNTGFDSGWMVGGYDQTIWYGNNTYSRYGHGTNDQTAWHWDWSNTITHGSSETVAEYRVSRAGLGLTTGGDQARLEFQTGSGSVTLETWAHSSEASVGTYTFGVIPEPASTVLVGLGALLLLVRRRK